MSRPAWLPAVLLLLPMLLGGPRDLRADEEDADLERRKEDLLLQLRIDHAIDHGMVWLARQQDRDGTFALEDQTMRGPFPQSRHRVGETALATLTLAHCGHPKDSREIERALRWLRRHHDGLMGGQYWPQASAYSLSILVLALHELFASEPETIERDDDDRYGGRRLRREDPCEQPRWVRDLVAEVLDWLLESRSEPGLFRYPEGLPGRGSAPPPGAPPGRGSAFAGPEDLSNTQYVLLALWAGTRCGYEIDPDVLVDIAERLLAVQERHGPPVERTWDPPQGDDGRYGSGTTPPSQEDRARGFGYTPGDKPTGSMTAAGLSSLAIVLAMLEEQGVALPGDLRARLRQGMWDAIAWLDHHYSVRQNPPDHGPLWHYYYLYGLERALVILGKERLGEHDWYRDGARLLVAAQEEDGAWRPPSPLVGFGGPPGASSPYDTALLDTCFALLFLKRASLRPRQPLLPPPVVTPGPDDAPAAPEGSEVPQGP